MRAAVLAFAAALVTIVRPPDARACTCALPALVVTPADATSNVPINAVVTLTGDDTLLPVLEDTLTMTPVEATLEAHDGWLVLRPAAPLAPTTSYTILPNAGNPTSAQPPARTFTTGTATDDTAPAFAGATTATANAYDLQSCASSCIVAKDSRASLLAFDYAAPPADTVVLTASVYRQSDHHLMGEVLLGAGDKTLGYNLCAPQAPALDPTASYCVRVTAYDVAGNAAGAAAEPCTAVSECASDACDDSGLACSMPVEPMATDDGGCCGTSGTGAGAVLPCAIVGLLLRRRRRSEAEREGPRARRRENRRAAADWP